MLMCHPVGSMQERPAYFEVKPVVMRWKGYKIAAGRALLFRALLKSENMQHVHVQVKQQE